MDKILTNKTKFECKSGISILILEYSDKNNIGLNKINVSAQRTENKILIIIVIFVLKLNLFKFKRKNTSSV